MNFENWCNDKLSRIGKLVKFSYNIILKLVLSTNVNNKKISILNEKMIDIQMIFDFETQILVPFEFFPLHQFSQINNFFLYVDSQVFYFLISYPPPENSTPRITILHIPYNMRASWRWLVKAGSLLSYAESVY